MTGNSQLVGPKPTGDRFFLEDFAVLSKFGQLESGGVERQAATEADGEQRRWFAGWLESHGFSVRVDYIGNIYGLKEFHPGAPFVMTGSHLDSQPNAGRFDGAYGVLASAHAAWRLAQHVESVGSDRYPFNIAVVNWFNEEGSRFTPSMMGSGVFTQKVAVARALATTDQSGISVETALTKIGFLGSDEAPKVAAYAEIHVEQGRTLDASGVTIGLVESTWAARKYQVTINGEQSHTGSTIMADRKDALAGAAAFILLANGLADTHQAPALHTAVSQLTVEPNSPVVVASRVTMNFDMRCKSLGVIQDVDKGLVDAVTEIETRFGVQLTRELTHEWDSQQYQAAGVALAREAAEALDLRYTEMQTIAGHDSTNMKDIVPSVMLFVPSVDGIAHNIGELTGDDDCLTGVDLLTEVLAKLCAGAIDLTEPAETEPRPEEDQR